MKPNNKITTINWIGIIIKQMSIHISILIVTPYLNHFSSSFTVTCCNYWCVNINESSFDKKFLYSESY